MSEEITITSQMMELYLNKSYLADVLSEFWIFHLTSVLARMKKRNQEAEQLQI